MKKFFCLIALLCAPLSTNLWAQSAPGSFLFYPYYGSDVGNANLRNTFITVVNDASAPQWVKFYFRDKASGTTFTQVICLTGLNSFEFNMNVYDPGITGSVYAMVVDANGVPIQANALRGMARIITENPADFSAARFDIPALAVKRLSSTPETVVNSQVTLSFDGAEYEKLPHIVVGQPLFSLNDYPNVTFATLSDNLANNPSNNPGIRFTSSSQAQKAAGPGSGINPSLNIMATTTYSGSGPHVVRFATSGGLRWLTSWSLFVGSNPTAGYFYLKNIDSSNAPKPLVGFYWHKFGTINVGALMETAGPVNSYDIVVPVVAAGTCTN
jgi:hypothetical protein